MIIIEIITGIRIFLAAIFLFFASQPIPFDAMAQNNSSLPVGAILSLLLFCLVLLTNIPYTYIISKENLIKNSVASAFCSTVHRIISPVLMIFALILFVEQNIIPGWSVCVITACLIINILQINDAKTAVPARLEQAAACVQAAGIILLYLHCILLSSVDTIFRKIMSLRYENVVYGAAAIYTTDENTASLFAAIVIWIVMIVTIGSCFNSIYKNLHDIARHNDDA